MMLSLSSFRIQRLWVYLLAIVALGSAGVFRPALAAELVYDNTQSYQTNYHDSTNEFGDEVKMSQGPVELTQFSIEYFGEFVPTGLELVRVRFYANDGADTDPRPDKVIRAPGTMLYESGAIPIAPGFNAVSLLGLAVQAPLSFTWTVEFSGMDKAAGAKAGLLFFKTPTIGSSFDDFWQKVNGQWALYRFGGNPVANFGSRALATNETALAIVETNRLAAGIQLKISGPPGRSVNVEFSTNAVRWVSIASFVLTNRLNEYLDALAPASGPVEYRVGFAEAGVMRFLGVKPAQDGSTALKYSGPPGDVYELQTSGDLRSWLTLFTGVFPAGQIEHTDRSAVLPLRFFRLQSGPVLHVTFDENSTHKVNDLFQLGIDGPPGRHVVLQASADLFNWVSLSTNQFSFTTGAITVVDAARTAEGRRFYRAVPLP